MDTQGGAIPATDSSHYLRLPLRARLPGKTVKALAFVTDPTHAAYAGHLSLEQTAERVARCCGARGPNLDYLIRTIEHLSELGVRDHNLLRVLAAARAGERHTVTARSPGAGC